ncbi:hypothetical protein ANI_1_2690014 [Paecilomyces variotii No. 5]|uniref:Uncharacterized protein n=1 Tax=Byssochlamys spectabilis (strain No. 5 / NBRC 109023) TaxID=1356009 RepID=V5G4W2_BYSSN|nr:hypothetical protein ANI_1_2690014 [Paecilomyces variotii No. 5]
MSANPSGRIPDAWDDDFERQADMPSTLRKALDIDWDIFCPAQTSATENPPAEKKVSSKISKAQRRAQHAEFNRQLWAEANSESSQSFHFLEARSDVPLKQDFKPTVTLLSRKPQIASRQSSSVDSAAAGVSRLGLNGEGDDDSDDEPRKAPEMTPEERQAKALRDREEKQRRYEEVRERLFGSPSATTSGASSPGSTTPPRQNHSGEGRGKGKGRGGGHTRDKRDSSSASSRSRQLYDPGYTAKPNSTYLQKKERQHSAERYYDEQQQSPQQPTRAPRGPDGSGRGGFGFSNRGARAS